MRLRLRPSIQRYAEALERRARTLDEEHGPGWQLGRTPHLLRNTASELGDLLLAYRADGARLVADKAVTLGLTCSEIFKDSTEN